MFQKSGKKFIFVLSGLDPSGKAGFVLDIRVITQLGNYAGGTSTAMTVQGFRSGENFVPTEPKILRQQIEAVWRDKTPDAVKIGMVPTTGIAEVIAKLIKKFLPSKVPVVWDPVMLSSDGIPLMNEAEIDAIFIALMEVVRVITPNIPEFERLFGVPSTDDAVLEAAENFRTAILLKGGHSSGRTIRDILAYRGKITEYFRERRPARIRGTGCALSSALAVYMALYDDLAQSFSAAENFMDEFVLRGNPPW